MKPNNLLKTLFLFFGLTFCANLLAQEAEGKTYKIISKGTVTDITPYIKALDKSDMKYHRLKYSRNIVEFNTGVQVELFSAAEMLAAGRTVPPNEYPEKFPANRDIPEFSLGPNDFIMEGHHVSGKHY